MLLRLILLCAYSTIGKISSCSAVRCCAAVREVDICEGAVRLYAGTSALQCYTSLDAPCEVYKNYSGQCLQDAGVPINCSHPTDQCMTTIRTTEAEPTYYYVAKACTLPNLCSPMQTSVRAGNRNLSQVVKCCSRDFCNAVNQLSNGSMMSPPQLVLIALALILAHWTYSWPD